MCRAWCPRPSIAPALKVVAAAGAICVALSSGLLAQPASDPQPEGTPIPLSDPEAGIREIVISLPLAAGLGAALALRPRRRGARALSAPVIETQIILAVIGALVMLVVGASLARAFGVVGVAGLVRYRAKIADPKDAGVMLSTLAIGLASGVGLYGMALLATLFIMIVLSLIEWFEPRAAKAFRLEIASKEAARLQPKIEDLLRRRRLKFELRAAAPEEISYALQLPMDMRTDALSTAIQALDEAKGTAVTWQPEKPPKS